VQQFIGTTKEVEERLNALGFERFEAVLPSPPGFVCARSKTASVWARSRANRVYTSQKREHGLSRSDEVGLQNPKGRFGD
jgi:hypothetical protein